MKLKLNVAMNGFAKGQEITIADVKGVPTESFWRRRLKDSEIDKCVEIVQTKPKSETKVKSNSRSTSK